MAPSTDPDSGPVDSQEIRMDIVPHHQKHHKTDNSLVKVAFTGIAVVGSIAGLYLLYKHFFGKKGENIETAPNGKRKLRKRDFKVDDFEERVTSLYAKSLNDEVFLEFLEEAQDAGLLNFLAEALLS